jgi:type IV pilus assembly protein PilY1
MMKKYSLRIIFLSVFVFTFISYKPGWCIEPSMGTYTSYPIFQTSAVEPNIMVLLDNSGSMNFSAYGTWPGDGGTVSDVPYVGEPYNNRYSVSVAISASSDDAQEKSGTVTTNGTNIYLGYNSGNYTDGFRFANLNIPPGAIITSAYIRFKAYTTLATSTSLIIAGEKVDNAATYTTTSNNISGRTATTASVPWTSIPAWTAGLTYKSPDLKTIVQEIVDRPGWSDGNAIAFKITNVTGSTGNRRIQTRDNGAGNAPVLYVGYALATGTTESVTYYGYFNPEYFYTWNNTTGHIRFEHKYKKISYSNSGYWVTEDLSGGTVNLSDTQIVTEQLWDGNWMNWLSMRRIDVLKKVLIGGKATRIGAGDYLASGEIPAQTSRYFKRTFDSSGGPAVSPYKGEYYYGVRDGYLYMDDDSDPWADYLFKYRINIHKDDDYDHNEFDSSGDYLVGVLQRIGDRARWGNESFYSGTGTGNSGGKIVSTMGTSVSTVAGNISAESGDTWTPLAESLYVASQYFKQQAPASGLDYNSSAVPISTSTTLSIDPYYNGATYVPCAKSFILLLTDGASTMDSKIPATLKDYDNDLKDNTACNESTGSDCDYVSSGTDYLDDVAFYAHTTDLRSATVGKSALDGVQNLTLYAVLAFDNDPNAVGLLKDAAKNGGFNDKNGNNIPDLQEEWDLNADDIPDNFYQASDGYKLESELLNAINDILKRAASGTAVSVLATSSEGEGNLVQAYFKPVVPSGLDEIKWAGYLQSLWVDSHGNLREDTVNDHALNVNEDKIVNYYTDPATGDTKLKVWNVSTTVPYPDTSTVPQDAIKGIDEITPIWEGAKRLSLRSANDRKIFTYIDLDNDSTIDESTDNPFDILGEVVNLKTDASDLIAPYLGVMSDSAWSELGATKEDRAQNLISYIRGTDITGFRTRTLDGKVWKLGDIIHSTPVSVSKPADNYHIIYSDQSYGTYYHDNLNRETVIYVGGNDGMLHAFTSGVYNSSTKAYTMPSGTETFGDELWAYIPHALLPHLKWLADPDYTHVYYVDLKPKVFDAKIDTNNDGIPDSWRTLLLIGLNLGGKKIQVTDDFDYDGDTTDTGDTRDFYSSYTCLDITDPRNPGVLWERSYDDLELTTSYPSVIKVGNKDTVNEKWFAVFGSGPSDYDGTSTKKGHVFVVDLQTGEPYQSSTGVDWLFETGESSAFMNSPVSVDVGLDYNVDAVYFGEAYYSSGIWQGKLYKVVVPWVNSTGTYDGTDKANYSNDPKGLADINKKWQLVPLLNATRPITSSVALSIDSFDNMWIYVGSGRYFNTSDKSNTDQQYMFGVKDPFFNPNPSNTNYYHKYSTYKVLSISDLLDSDRYIILEGGEVLLDSDTPKDGVPNSTFGSWSNLLTEARNKDGWVRSLTISGERITTKFTILGGIVFTPSFVPASNVCGYGGDSYLYGQYYETGTAYYRAVFINGKKNLIFGEALVTQVLDKASIGSGMASSVGVHVGKEGSKGFIQTSSGTIVEQELETAFNVKSGLRSWMEK